MGKNIIFTPADLRRLLGPCPEVEQTKLKSKAGRPLGSRNKPKVTYVKAKLTNPINISGAETEEKFKETIESYMGIECKRYLTKTYELRKKKKTGEYYNKETRIYTNLNCGEELECILQYPLFPGSQSRVDAAIWNPMTRKIYFCEFRGQNTGGTTEDKSDSYLRKQLTNPKVDSRVVFIYAFDSPGIKQEKLEAIQEVFLNGLDHGARQHEFFTKFEEFVVFINKPLEEWPIP